MAYYTNTLSDLKKEALIKKDLDTLKKIRKYEDFQGNRKFYYVRENETIIRDRDGNAIDPMDLPFDQDETHMHLLTIDSGKILLSLSDQPGDKINEINFIGSESNHWDFSTQILECLPDQVFPLPENFDWFKMCESSPKRNLHVHHNHRLNGKPGYKSYRWINANGANMITSNAPESGIDYTVTEIW